MKIELYSDMLNREMEIKDGSSYLDALYMRDGRSNPGHPDYATFSGLYIQRAYELVGLEEVHHAASRSLFQTD